MASLQTARILFSDEYGDHTGNTAPNTIPHAIDELARLCLQNQNGEILKGENSGPQVLLDLTVGDLHCILERRPPQGDAVPAITLSPREAEIARMIAQGYPNKIIAAVLDISSWTVGTHVRHLFAKLQVTSRAAMVAKLSEFGLLDAFNRMSPSKR